MHGRLHLETVDLCQDQMPYLAMSTKIKLNAWICLVIRIHPKIEWVLPWPLVVFPLSCWQTDKQTNKPHRKHNLLGEGYDTCKAINGQQPIGNHSCHAARGRRAILGVLAYDRSVSVGSFYLARGISWAVECMWCCITAKSLCCMDLKKMYRDSFQFCKVEHWVKHSDDSRRAVQTTWIVQLFRDCL